LIADRLLSPAEVQALSCPEPAPVPALEHAA